MTNRIFAAAQPLAVGLLSLAGALAAPVSAPAQERKTLEAYDASTVVATVGEKQITLGDMLIARPRLPQNVEISDYTILFDEILRSLVTAEMIAQAAEKAGVAEDPGVKMRLEALRRTTLGQVYLARLAGERITDESLRKLYDEMMQNEITSAPFTQTSFRLIQLEDKKAAEDALAAVKGGSDFAELAKKLSTHVSNRNGGFIDYHSPGARVSPIDQAAMAMKNPGDLSEVIEANGKFYLVKLEGKRALEYNQVVPVLRRISYDRIAAAELEKLKKEIPVKNADALPPGEAIMKNDLLK